MEDQGLIITLLLSLAKKFGKFYKQNFMLLWSISQEKRHW